MSYMKRYAEDVAEVQEAASLAALHDTPRGCLKAISKAFELCGTLAQKYHDPHAVASLLVHEAALFYMTAIPRAVRGTVAA
ncbi:hypothetical protein [Streptomyces hundungensis]|uniref:hypothetical protein n=1 Tax=Streptomyces hundungensis TaxID=1077946 RepID=UPI0031E84279